MTTCCQVAHCRFKAESEIEGFMVCLLHDHDNVRAMLEDLKLPTAFWTQNRPIVMPCGDLTEGDFETIEGDFECPSESSLLLNAETGPHICVYEGFALL